MKLAGNVIDSPTLWLSADSATLTGIKNVIYSFNYFRAVAILFVVAGHTYYAAGLEFDSLAEQASTLRQVLASEEQTAGLQEQLVGVQVFRVTA